MAKHRPTTGVKPSNKKRKAAATTGGGPSTKRSKPSSGPVSNSKASQGDEPNGGKGSGGPTGKKVKKAKLRDQPYIPVPGSEFKAGSGSKGKARASAVRGDNDNDDEDEDLEAGMDSDEDDDNDDVMAAMGENEEEAGLEYLTGAGASTGFLTGLDVKALSR